MQKTVRIQPVASQNDSRKAELHAHSPSERMQMVFTLIDRSTKHTRLARVATIRHVPF